VLASLQLGWVPRRRRGPGVRWRGATASGRATGPAKGENRGGREEGGSLTSGAARSERGRGRGARFGWR
jgi:hypothetical protein